MVGYYLSLSFSLNQKVCTQSFSSLFTTLNFSDITTVVVGISTTFHCDCFVHELFMEMARFQQGAWEALIRIVLFMSCDSKRADPRPVGLEAWICIVLFMK